MTTELACTLATDAGMHALWRPDAFARIHDYDTWDAELGEGLDVERQILGANLVPINIGFDGVFAFLVRTAQAPDQAHLTDRETQYLLVSSEPYLLNSDGQARLSGIEHISGSPDDRPASIPLPPGPHHVTIHLVDWTAEPGAANPDGTPTAKALPDFVILIAPADPAASPRTNLMTFDMPEPTEA